LIGRSPISHRFGCIEDQKNLITREIRDAEEILVPQL
jgi:hypothetical protein